MMKAKKQLSLFAWALAVFGMAALLAPPSSVAATNLGASGASSANLTDGPEKKSNTKVTEYKKYETRTSTATYTVKPKAAPASAQRQNLYYVTPERRAAESATAESGAVSGYSLMSRAPAAKKAPERKYYLAHPFFQPQEGRFGSLTDIGYSVNSYNFDISNGIWDGQGGEWSAKQFFIKEDLSYGVTDTVAIVGSAKYSNTKYAFDWNDPMVDDDSMRAGAFDVLGLGMQWRFYDDAEWISYIGAYYQWWKDLASVVVADAKVGYKVNANAMVYGLARLYYVGWEENSYGNGIDNEGSGQSLYIAYDQDVDSSLFFEGGVGFFTVMSDDWTLNLEGVLGSYGWHSQGSLKAALGWQPTKSFALNLYGKAAVFDSADSAEGLGVYSWYTALPATVLQVGEAAISKYGEMTFGLQAALYF
jgi:hypothetical protein